MRVVSWMILVLVFVAAVATVGAAAFTYVNVRNIVAESPIDFPALPQVGAQPTRAALFGPTKTAVPVNTLQVQGSATQDANVTQAASSAEASIAPLADPSRVTILLLGIDQRQGEKGPFRTDTIMVLSLDPVRKTGAMLSIPRDLYIPIPGFNKADRINNANVIGDISQYPGGGPALAVKTVQSLLGVPIHRYMMINFDVFTTVIDAIGPIQVCPNERIHDESYPDGSYGFITVDFPAGCQELDSTKLLQYARVRHAAGDDFGRATRQQEVIRGVREKVMSLGGISSLLGQSASIWAKLKDSIKTDLTFEEMLQLAQAAQSIPKENIKSQVITDRENYMLPTTLPSGEQVFSPVYERIHALMETLFDAAPGGTTNALASSESATVVVSNGAGIDGMAKLTADKLKEKGFNITEVKNADLPGGYAKTIIRVFTNKVKTARYIAEVLGLDGTAITSETNGGDGVDIEVVVGKDLAPNSP
jgi:LCP family protein required for cell wall assembly